MGKSLLVVSCSGSLVMNVKKIELTKSISFTVILMFVVLFIVSCSTKQPTLALTSTPPATSTMTRTPTPSATLKLSPTTTYTPRPSVTPTPSPVEPLSIGLGSMRDLVRSPDGSIAAFKMDNFLYWFNTSSGDELGSYEITSWYLGNIIISPDNRYILFQAGLGAKGYGAQIIDTQTKRGFLLW